MVKKVKIRLLIQTHTLTLYNCVYTDYDDLDLSSSTAKRPPSTNIDKSEKKKAKKERQQKKTTKQKGKGSR